MCVNNMLNMSMSQRLDYILTQLRVGAVRKDAAIAFTALSEGETGYLWYLDRPTTLKWAGGVPDWCCGVPIGIETGQNFTKALAGAPTTLQFLKGQSLLTVDPNNSSELKPANGFGNPARQDLNMAAFETTVSAREESALPIYSVGPFQLNQALYGRACGFPSTWEELWDLYVGGSNVTIPADIVASGKETDWLKGARFAYMVKRWGRYNIPKSYIADGCRSNSVQFPNGSRETDLAWLDGHAGNRTVSTWAYDGDQAHLGARRPYKTVWSEVSLRASTMFPDWV